MKRIDELLKNTFIIALGTLSTKILSFLLVPLYTLWLNPTEYGEFDLLSTYVAFIVPFATFQLEQAIFRFIVENKTKANKYFNSAMNVVILNLIVCNILILILLKNNSLLIPFMLYFNFYTLYSCDSEYLRGTEKLKKYSFCNILVSLFIIIFNIIFVYKLKFQVFGMLLSYALAYFLGVVFISISERNIELKRSNEKVIQKEMIKYSLPLIPNSISWWIINVSDRSLIKIYLGNFYNGIYAVSCKIPVIVNLLFSIFNLSWQQTAVKTLNDKDKNKFYNNIFLQLITFLFTTSILVVCSSEFIFHIFINKQYYAGIYQIPILVNGLIYLSFAQFLNAIFLANKKTKSVGITTIISAIINIIINFMLLNKIGIYAASISTFISYLALFIIRYIALSKNFETKKIFLLIGKYNVILIIFSLFLYFNTSIYIKIIVLMIAIIYFINKNKKICNLLLNKVLKR